MQAVPKTTLTNLQQDLRMRHWIRMAVLNKIWKIFWTNPASNEWKLFWTLTSCLYYFPHIQNSIRSFRHCLGKITSFPTCLRRSVFPKSKSSGQRNFLKFEKAFLDYRVPIFFSILTCEPSALPKLAFALYASPNSNAVALTIGDKAW